MPTMLGADCIVKTLAKEGIRHLFTLPGGQLLPVYYSLMDENGIQAVFCRHEGAAALMAAGYSLATGGPGCVMSTVGAGIAYEVGSLYYAWRERLPVISISPQVQSHKMKPMQENLQGCEQDLIFRPITKFTAILYHRKRIPDLIRRAIACAAAPEPGPVHLDVPVDVIYGYEGFSRAERKKLFPDTPSSIPHTLHAPRESLMRAAELISAAERPIVLIGREVERKKAGSKLEGFLAAARLPVITSTASYASVSGENELNMGQVPQWMSPEGCEILAQADMMVLLEADEETGALARELFRRNPGIRTIQIAEHAAAVGSLVPTETGLLASVASAVSPLAEMMFERPAGMSTRMPWIDRLAQTRRTIERAYLQNIGDERTIIIFRQTIQTIAGNAHPDDIIFCEGPVASRVAMICLRRRGVHNTFILSNDCVTGAGYPLALGAKFACPQRRVLLVTESNRFKHHLREMQTAGRYGRGVSVYLFNTDTPKTIDYQALAESLQQRMNNSYGLEVIDV